MKMLGAELELNQYLNHCISVLERAGTFREAKNLSKEIYNAYESGKTVFICGNGGSGSNSSHFCEDLLKSTLRDEDFNKDDIKRLRVISLTDNTPCILAWANDTGFDQIFVQQLKNLASSGDVLIAISGSGNSLNTLNAAQWANRNGLHTWGVTGFGGGLLKDMSKNNLHFPLYDMGMVESIHLLLFHWIIGDVHARINQVERYAVEGDNDGKYNADSGTQGCSQEN